MNKSDVVRALANRTGLTIQNSESYLDALLDLIGLSLACGEPVNIYGFGVFEPRERGPVKRRNPRTGEIHSVPPKMAVGFRPSAILKSRVNEED